MARGSASAPALVREPEGDGCAELLIRRLEEGLRCARRFATIGSCGWWCWRFSAPTYRSWIVERHGWRPHARARADRLGLAALA